MSNTNESNVTAAHPNWEFTDETMQLADGTVVRRIRFPDGYLGGWIEKESNLAEYGRVYGDAMVYGNAVVSGYAAAYDNACVYGNARLSGYAAAFENACVYDNAIVSGEALLLGNAKVYDNAEVTDRAIVHAYAQVSGCERLSGDEWVSEERESQV